MSRSFHFWQSQQLDRVTPPRLVNPCLPAITKPMETGTYHTDISVENREKYDVTSPWQHYFWMTTKPTTTATERQKSKRFLLTKQQIYTCIKLFCTFFCRRCAHATGKFPISHACFMEQVNTTQKLSFSSPKLRYGTFGFKPSEFCQHLPN